MSNLSTIPSGAASAIVIPFWKTFTVFAMGCALAAGFWSTRAINQHGEAGISMDLPPTVGAFNGTPQEISSSEKAILPEDTEFAKSLYKSFSDDQVTTQIVLAGAEKRSIHRPEVCLPAQGWTITSKKVVPIKLDNGETMEVQKLLISRPHEIRPGEFRPLNYVFFYWFVGSSITTPSHWTRIFLTSWDRVVHRTNHRWAYVIVYAGALKDLAYHGKNVEETQEMLERFTAELAPQIVLKWKHGNKSAAQKTPIQTSP